MLSVTALVNELFTDKKLLKLFQETKTLNMVTNAHKNLDHIVYTAPPMFIPLWEGSEFSMSGILKHWFIERSTIFTEFDIAEPYFIEDARNADQFITDIFLSSMAVFEEIKPIVMTLSNILKFQGLEELYKHAIKYGDDPKQYYKVMNFEIDLPLKYVESINEYHGDFLSSNKIFNLNSLQTSSPFELAPNHYDKLNELNNVPPWFKKETNKKELFETYLSNNELDKAWLTLNSFGWKYTDVEQALLQLKERTKDKGFHLMVDNWIDNWKNSDMYGEVEGY